MSAGSRRQWGAGFVALLIGLGAVTVVRGLNEEQVLVAARETDLVRLLDDLQARNERLDTELARLEAAELRLRNGTDVEALAETQERLADLQILAGTTAATGPGIVVTVSGRRAFFASDMLNMVQELRDAGAEAIQINSERVVVNTWFDDVGRAVKVSGVPMTAPFVITAIGTAETMATALQIPGGVQDTVEAQGGQVSIETPAAVTIDATVELSDAGPKPTARQ